MLVNLPWIVGTWNILVSAKGLNQIANLYMISKSIKARTLIYPICFKELCSWTWLAGMVKTLRCVFSLLLSFGVSGCSMTGNKWPWLWSLFTIYRTSISQRYQRRDLVLVCNCVRACPHAVPSASSVSSPNLCCLSSDKWYPPQIKIQCPCPAQLEGKGSPVLPCEVQAVFLAS